MSLFIEPSSVPAVTRQKMHGIDDCVHSFPFPVLLSKGVDFCDLGFYGGSSEPGGEIAPVSFWNMHTIVNPMQKSRG